MTVYRVVSSDSHIVEPPDIWTERMPKKFGDRIPRLVHEEHGDWWYADGIRLLSISAGTDAGVRFERPGDYRKEAYFEQVRPGAYLPPEKLKDMESEAIKRGLIEGYIERYEEDRTVGSAEVTSIGV